MSTTVLKYTDEDLRYAKKGGFKKKKPSLKKTGSYTQIMNRVKRYNQWVNDLKHCAKKGRDLDKLKANIDKAKY